MAGKQAKGLIRFDRKTEEYQIYSLNEILHKSVDDILCLHWHGEQLYVGTTSGLVRVTFKERKLEADYIGREQGLLNDMIHSILEDANGLLWLGTNRGLIKFNPENSFSHAYYYSGGIQIGESLAMMHITVVHIPVVFSSEESTDCSTLIRRCRQHRNIIRKYYCVS